MNKCIIYGAGLKCIFIRCHLVSMSLIMKTAAVLRRHIEEHRTRPQGMPSAASEVMVKVTEACKARVSNHFLGPSALKTRWEAEWPKMEPPSQLWSNGHMCIIKQRRKTQSGVRETSNGTGARSVEGCGDEWRSGQSQAPSQCIPAACALRQTTVCGFQQQPGPGRRRRYLSPVAGGILLMIDWNSSPRRN